MIRHNDLQLDLISRLVVAAAAAAVELAKQTEATD